MSFLKAFSLVDLVIFVFKSQLFITPKFLRSALITALYIYVDLLLTIVFGSSITSNFILVLSDYFQFLIYSYYW